MSENMENQVSANPAGEFGRLLRTQRESKGLSIGEVAERLKLSAKQIEAFEAGELRKHAGIRVCQRVFAHLRQIS